MVFSLGRMYGECWGEVLMFIDYLIVIQCKNINLTHSGVDLQL